MRRGVKEPAQIPKLPSAMSHCGRMSERLTESMKPINLGKMRRKPLFTIYRIPLVFIILVMGAELLFTSTLSFPSVNAVKVLETPINNKIFHHNRTTLGLLEQQKVRRKPSKSSPVATTGTGSTRDKTKTKTNSSKNNKKPKPSVTTAPQLKLSQPVKTNVHANNYNNYFTAAVNFLNMALSPSSTTPRSVSKGSKHKPYKNPSNSSKPSNASKPKSKPKFVPSPMGPVLHEMLPSPQPFYKPQQATLHPFSVLKTEISGSGSKNSSDLEGRSNFEFEPLYESNYRENDTGPSAGNKKLKVNFFDEFEDHWEDPIAEESVAPTSYSTGPAPAYAPAPYRYDVPWRNKAAALKHGPTGPTSFSSEAAYDTTGTGSGSGPSGGSHSYADHKNPNYWPHKLNSYYGEGLNSQLHNSHQPRRPLPLSNHYDGSKLKHAPPRPQVHRLPGNQAGPFNQNNIAERTPQKILTPQRFQHHQDEPLAAGSDSVQKTSMIDRVSVFYSDHKLFTWAVVSIIAALAALGVLLALYYNSPPTEVVTAKRELERSLQDPQLLAFISNPILKGIPEPQLPTNTSTTGTRSRKRTKSRPKDET